MPKQTKNRQKPISQAGMSRALEICRILRSGKAFTSKNLADELERDVRTIGRDIAFLKSMGADIKFDFTENTYRLVNQSWSLPFFQLSEGELVQLLVAEQMVQQARGTPLADTLIGLFDKIRQNLTEKADVDPLVLQGQISFHSRPARRIKPEIWGKLFDALRKNRIAKISYDRHYEKPWTLEVEPIHIACVDGDWYLVACPHGEEFLRTYALSRIQEVSVTDRGAEIHEFDPAKFFENRLGRYVGDPGQTTDLVLEFTGDATRAVKEREWHPRQMVKELGDGRLRLTMPVPSEAWLDIRTFILQWGAAVKVIKPSSIRDKIKKEARSILNAYKPR